MNQQTETGNTQSGTDSNVNLSGQQQQQQQAVGTIQAGDNNAADADAEANRDEMDAGKPQ